MQPLHSTRRSRALIGARALAVAVGLGAFTLAAGPEALLQVPMPALSPPAGPSATFLARLPGLRLDRVYYVRGDPRTGAEGEDHLECLDLRSATPGSPLHGGPFLTWRPDERIGDYTISPDGRWAAMLMKSPGYPANTDVTNIHLADLQSGQTRALTTDWAGYDSPTWSCDSRQVAYLSAEGETNGVIPPPMLPLKRPSWTVYVQSVAAGRRKRLFRQRPGGEDAGVYLVLGLTWVPGRRTLLYPSVAPRGLFLLPADGRRPLRLTQRIPCDADLACRRGYWLDEGSHTVRIFSLPADPAALERPATWRSPRVLATLRLPGNRCWLTFSPDGQRVLVRSQRSDGDPEGQYLAVVDLAQRTVRAFGRIEPREGVRWSRDGRYLLWEQRTPEDAGNLTELVAVRADAAPAQPLASVDWWRESGVKPTVLVRMADLAAGKLRWVEGK